MDITQAKQAIYREVNNAFGHIDKTVFNGKVDVNDNTFELITNKNFELFKCSNGGNCTCIASVSKDGFSIYCKKCSKRLPITGYFPNTQKMNESLIVIGIQVNNTNNYFPPVSLPETYITYPMHHSLFENPRRLEKFQEILRSHDLQQLIDYHTCKYKYIPQYKKWIINDKDVNEDDVFEDIRHFYSTLIEELCSFYRQNEETPIINGKCYNKHILINLAELYRCILRNKKQILELLRETRSNEEYIQVLEHNVNTFLKKLYPKKGFYMKMDMLYEAYIHWMNLDTTNYVDKIYTKRELKGLVEEHLEKHVMFEYKKYKLYRNKLQRYYCFRDIEIQLFNIS
jgi:hypothetical protein